MSPYIIAAALLPGLAISFWIYQKDKYEKEPRLLVLMSFLFGCLSTVPALLVQMQFKHLENAQSLVATAIFSFIVIALTEELSKFFFLRFYAYPRDAFNEPFDGIVYGVMVGMGFATLENILYVINAESGWSVLIGRALTAVPAHATFGILMGASVGLAKFRPEQRSWLMLRGLLLATFFHGLYDFFLLQKVYEGLLVLSLLGLFVCIRLSRQLIADFQDISPFKNGDVASDEEEEDNDDDENDQNNEETDEKNEKNEPEPPKAEDLI